MNVFQKSPAIPNLRGEKNGNNSNKTPFEKRGIFIEEVGNIKRMENFQGYLDFLRKFGVANHLKKKDKEETPYKN